jgi:archaellum biogenesis protein FlaJ (TadC family)
VTPFWEVAVPLFVVFGTAAWIIKTILDHSIRRRLIDKGMVGPDNKYLYVERVVHRAPSSIKWGMVLVAVGAAIFIGQLLPYDIADEYTVAFMFIFGGAALLIYAAIARKLENRTERAENTAQ